MDADHVAIAGGGLKRLHAKLAIASGAGEIGEMALEGPVQDASLDPGFPDDGMFRAPAQSDLLALRRAVEGAREDARRGFDLPAAGAVLAKDLPRKNI
jgi:hypothetical protein